MKTLMFGVSLLLSVGAVCAQNKPLDLRLKFEPRVIAYTEPRPITKDAPALQSQGLQKEIYLPAAQWTESGVTYTTGIIPRKIVLRVNW